MTFFMSHVHRWRELQMMSDTQFSTKNGGVWSFMDWQPKGPRVLQSPSLTKGTYWEWIFMFQKICPWLLHLQGTLHNTWYVYQKWKPWKIGALPIVDGFQGPPLGISGSPGCPKPLIFRWISRSETSEVRCKIRRKKRLRLLAQQSPYKILRVYGCFLKWWYPQVIHFNRVFHINPSILGYHNFWNPPI